MHLICIISLERWWILEVLLRGVGILKYSNFQIALLWKSLDGSWWSKLLLGYVSFDGQAHAICVLFFKEEQVLWCYEGAKCLLSFNGTSIKQSAGYCMWCDPKSYNRCYVHFSVPWIFEVIANDPCAGTTNDCLCCLYQLSIHVGICSICRPWFLQGLLGSWALLLHL